MGATRANMQRASWLPSHQCFCFPVSPNLLSQSRHRRRRPSSAPHPLRSSGLGCWPLRSCRLNCQSLWTSLIGRGGRPSTGGWDTHAHTEGTGTCTRGGVSATRHTDTPGYEFMHDTRMNNLCTCMQSHTMRTGQRRTDNTNTAARTKG